MQQKLKTLSIFLASTLLAACGNDGGNVTDISGGGGGGTTTPETGVFLDAAVAGVSYATTPGGLTGITNDEGEYEFEPGDTVTFSIGELDFPPVTAKGTVTPLDMAGTDDPTNQIVVNVVRLLQTLDVDGNPDNGISVTEAARNNGVAVVFDQSVDDFAADTEVLRLVEVADLDTPLDSLISAEQARAHLEESLAGEGLSFGSLVGAWGVSETEEDENDLLGFIFLGDGTYIHVEVDLQDAEEESGIEWGTWSRSAETGLMTVTQEFDENGSTGLTDFVGSDTNSVSVQVLGDSFVATVVEGSEEGSISFDRLADDGIVGAWLIDSITEAGGEPVEDENDFLGFVFLPSNEYIHIEVDVDDQDEDSGMEWGSYTLSEQNVFAIDGQLGIDTNGDTGASSLVPDGEYAVLAVDGDVLTISIYNSSTNELQATLTFNRI